MKVYVVIAGCYSDKHIVAVTLDREKAEAVRVRIARKDSEDDDYAYVMDYDTDDVDGAYEAYKLGYNMYHVHISESGSLTLVSKDDEMLGDGTAENHTSIGSNYYVWAKDQEAALKIATDRHAMWKAQQEGIS